MACALNPELSQRFQQSSCTGHMREVITEDVVHWCTVPGWSGNRRLKSHILRHWKLWGLHVRAHQVVNFFHLVGVLASIKQLGECASDTVTSVLQRGATAEDMGWGLPWEGSTGSCSVTPGVWAQQQGKVGLPSGHGEQQDHSPPRGLLAPRVRWGGSGWTDAFGLGEGPRGERSLEPSLGGRGKARWVIARPMQMMVVFWKQLRARWTGPQRPSFILLFLCKTRCQSLRCYQETSEPSAAVASSKGLGPCPHPHWG